MTRFARAIGSKSSNKKEPDEATPWHVMKQQLEESLSQQQQEGKKKTKSAKQLLKEQDDLNGSKSLDNVKTVWAEFDTPKDKKISVKNGKVKKITNNKEKKTKKAVKQTIVADLVTPCVTCPDKKSEESKSSADTKESKLKNKKEETTSSDGDVIKLSKRQKRNKKKQLQKNNQTEGDSVGIFNVKENDWDSSVKINDTKQTFDNNNKKKKIINSDQRQNNGSPVKNREWMPDFEWKNWKRFGNNVPKKFPKKIAKKKDDLQHNRRKPDDESLIKMTINGMDVEIVKYDGYPVKKDDAERLKELRQQMVLKGIPKTEIDAAMKLERRKCEKALARIKKQVCFHCRNAGHNLSDCPELRQEETVTGICFKCGSTEHTHFECKVKKSDDYGYAKCFICREQGHIAKQCPDNPKGLYPDGGSCKVCGDVTHLKKDCPDLVKEKEDADIKLGTIKNHNLESLDGETFNN